MENNKQVSDKVVKKFKAGLDYETIAQTFTDYCLNRHPKGQARKAIILFANHTLVCLGVYFFTSIFAVLT